MRNWKRLGGALSAIGVGGGALAGVAATPSDVAALPAVATEYNKAFVCDSLTGKYACNSFDWKHDPALHVNGHRWMTYFAYIGCNANFGSVPPANYTLYGGADQYYRAPGENWVHYAETPQETVTLGSERCLAQGNFSSGDQGFAYHSPDEKHVTGTVDLRLVSVTRQRCNGAYGCGTSEQSYSASNVLYGS